MSRPSTAQQARNPSVARPSAWSKGPPTSAPSRSQSPAPSTPTFHSHSRRPSALSGVSIKDGVTVNKNNAGAAKQGSAVTFGSIDDVSAPISSSPAAAPAIKSESVKSFGTIDADTHVNGKSTLSARPSVAVPASSTSSSASSPAVSVASAALKLGKPDIAKLFQNPSSAPSSHPPSDTSSPSLRPTGLPSSQHPPSSQPSQSSVPSQPSQLSSHPSFTPYRHPPSGAGSGPSRSPAYPPPRQSVNGSGPRTQGGPNGAPSQINPGMPSPRLAPMPHNGQPAGMPPPPQMQVGQQVPVAWPGYYYPSPDTYGYPPHQAWYQPQHHLPGGPHGPPHTGMPISPRNPPIPLQPGSGTPTLSHAAANPVHSPHPPPPLAHPSASMGSISSPPPTPSTNTSRLNANSSAFAPRPKVTFKTAEGLEVALGDLSSKTSASPSPANNAPANGQGTFRQGSPANGNPNRRGVRMETEDQQRRRLAEEERAKAEAEDKVRKEKEAEARKKREQEELKRKEEEATKKKEEEAKKKKEEEEKERIRKEEEEKERVRKEEEERVRKEVEEKERLRKEEEERERVRLEEAENEKKRKEEEEKERIRKEEEERQREEEERKRKEEEEAEEERERLRKEEEEKERQRQEAEKASRAKELEEEAEASQSREEGELDALEEHDIVSSPKSDFDKKFKEPLRINTSEAQRRRPDPLDLSNAGPVSAAPRSAIAAARVIDDLSRVSYPEGIASPQPDLNANAKDGKFRYDRDFLMQFMAICKEKPDMLPPLDAIGLEPIDQANLTMQRGGSGRHRQSSGPSAVQRGNSIGLGFASAPGFSKSSGLNPFAAGGMGNFTTTGKLTSDERFQNSSRSASVSGMGGFGGRPVAMQRTSSQGGPGGVASNRTRSQRGKQREKMPVQQTSNVHGSQLSNFEPVAPLKVSENRWDRKALHVEGDSPEVVDRKVRGLLNKLTMERFDSISDQIIEWANKSEKEKDGRTLIQVIRLVFEKATDEATWSEMYARLCRKMMEQISTKVQDDGIRNNEGKPIAGGQLFRKYLLNRCQEDFERGWVTKEATAAAAATKAMEDQAIKAAHGKGEEGGEDEVALYSEEYYAAQKAKRQGLGLIKFIGELFKLQMLTERIMHECVKKLLGNVNNPEEEEIESLCKLLSTVGQSLDTPKAHGHMDVYFKRMRELAESTNVSSRMQFMLQDLLEFRQRKWVARNAVAAPSTIAQIHEAAAKEKAAQEKELSQRQISMSRGGSRRGGDRNEQPPANPEGWAVAGNTARPPSKVDLSNFGKINKAPPTTFGPGSVFAGKKDKRESLSRSNSSANMFSMLQNAESGADKAAEALPQRKKLALLPRTKPIENETETEAQQQESDEEQVQSPTAEMSDEAALKKIDEDSKELFGVRNLSEAEVYFSSLPSQHHHKLVEKLVSTAVESKEADARLVSDLFGIAASKSLCSPAAFEEGFAPVAEIIVDLAIDAPKAFDLFAIIVKGASLDEDRRSRLASKSEDSEKLLLLLS